MSRFTIPSFKWKPGDDKDPFYSSASAHGWFLCTREDRRGFRGYVSHDSLANQHTTVACTTLEAAQGAAIAKVVSIIATMMVVED